MNDAIPSEADILKFQNMSGILNLLAFWKATAGNLIPEHLHAMQPPVFIALPTNELLTPRIEATRRRDYRTLPLPGGDAKTVERMDWSDARRDVYVSGADVRAARLSAALLKGGRVWWLDTEAVPGENREWRYRTWHAVLQWIDTVGQQVAERFADAFPTNVRRVVLVLPDASEFERIETNTMRNVALEETLRTTQTSEGGLVEITTGWLPYLSLRENVAEVALVAAVFKCLASPPNGPSIAELQIATADASGSSDWRWLHAQQLIRTEERLMAAGLTRDFRAIPFSARALVRCGSVWKFRDRSLGVEIDGKEECQAFIAQYYDEMLSSLIADVRGFDRASLCVMSARRHQDARAEQSRWRSTIRAIRAIHGESAEASALARQNEISGAMRASKVICEIAASEAPVTDAKRPSRTEIDEMFAKVMLIFGNGQLYSAIVTDLISAKIRISPGGDLLTERETLVNILRPGVEWLMRKRYDEAAAAYGSLIETESSERTPFDTTLREVLEAEYRISVEGFFNLQDALVELAEERREAVPVLLRSELARWLAQNEQFPASEVEPLLERLTLPARNGWFDLSSGLRTADFDFGKFDRPWSLINRPLLALDNSPDPKLVLSPMLVSDATFYSLSGLMDGSLNERYWVSAEARRYAGAQGKAAGDAFEDRLATRLRARGLEVIPRCKLSTVLNQKVSDELGDIDALAITPDRRRVWVIEAKNLRLCRTEAEAAARMWEYRGDLVTDERGRQRPDKMLRHLRRVDYLRRHRERLPARLKLPDTPEVLGLLVVESPQPMNFHTLTSDPDARSVFFDVIDEFSFSELQ